MIDLYGSLQAARIPFAEYGPTAIDSFLGVPARAPVAFILAECGIVDLARVFEFLFYPGLPYADAALGEEQCGIEARFRCVEDVARDKVGSSPLMDFRRDPSTGIYRDPSDAYQVLRKGRLQKISRLHENALFEAALMAARFPAPENAAPETFPVPPDMSPLWQKDLLALILQSPHSSQALELLRASGFMKAYWPELDDLLRVDHSKEFHPEGGGWLHTMQALDCRKDFGLGLSLAILLHDIGKPRSESRGGKKFDGHAEIGAKMASSFLRRLGFPPAVISDAAFMIRWHMLVAALPSVPVSGIRDIVFDPRFTDLLELYRCDEFSSFKGPDGYHAACAAYKACMKNRRNPYRDENGRKLSPSALGGR